MSKSGTDHGAHMVEACPECDSYDVYTRKWKEGGVRVTEDERYRCGACDAEFPEPLVRVSRRLDPEVRKWIGGDQRE